MDSFKLLIIIIWIKSSRAMNNRQRCELKQHSKQCECEWMYVRLWIPVVSISIPSLCVMCIVCAYITFVLGGFSWISGHAFTKTPNVYDFIAVSPRLQPSRISTAQLAFPYNGFHLNINKIKQRFMNAGKRLYLRHHQHKQKGNGATRAMVSAGYQKMKVRDKFSCKALRRAVLLP